MSLHSQPHAGVQDIYPTEHKIRGGSGRGGSLVQQAAANGNQTRPPLIHLEYATAFDHESFANAE